MSHLNFPLKSTKIPGLTQSFELSDPGQRQLYFKLKAGPEIQKIKSYLENHTFIAMLIGNKNSGKGTQVGLYQEIFGDQKIELISVGDITRKVFGEIQTPSGLNELKKYLQDNYRGPISVDEALEAFKNKTQSKLIPTEFVLNLITREIERLPKKALFIDGFPRSVDQVQYSLYLRHIINFRNDPDFLILFDIPEKVIEARMMNRAICPKCQTSKNLKLNPSSQVAYDQNSHEFYFLCDKIGCGGGRLTPKAGDDQGIESIRERLNLDQQLLEITKDIHGINKIYIRNHVPVDQASTYFDDYEITPEYYYEFNPKNQKVETKTKPWIVKDDQGIDSFSLLPQTTTVASIKQLAGFLPNI